MRNSRYRFTRLVMVIAAILFLLTAGYVLAKPELVLADIAVTSTPEVLWLLQLMGVLFLALGIHQATTSRNAADPAFRRVALLSVLIEIALALVVYKAPGELTRARLVLVSGSGLGAFLYLVTLPIKPVGYRETKKAD
jgi:hypothetical protein